jgi:hypothetical protein
LGKGGQLPDVTAILFLLGLLTETFTTVVPKSKIKTAAVTMASQILMLTIMQKQHSRNAVQ